MNQHRMLLLAFGTSLALLGVACGSDESSSPATAAPPPAATDAPAPTSPAETAPPAAALAGVDVMYHGAFDSPYCVNARDWAAHETDEHDWSGPAADNMTYWAEYRAFTAKGSASAPDEIAADWKLYDEFNATVAEPVLEKYEYDSAKLEAEGTPEDQALFADEPPAPYGPAIENVMRYEVEVCKTDQSYPADVEYDPATAAAYCAAAVKVPQPPYADPVALKEWVASFDIEATKAIDNLAPADMAADLIATDEWTLTHMKPVLEAHDYDIRKVYREGTEQELTDLLWWSPEIVDANARVLAFQSNCDW